MNKLFLAIVLILISSCSFAQSNSDYVGMWKCIVKASGLKANNTYPTYMVFNEDGTYIWGIDSTASDPMKGTSGGTWSITDEGQIKLISSDTSAEIRYYVPSGKDRYQYEFFEKGGKKQKVQMLEMDFYIFKISADTDK